MAMDRPAAAQAIRSFLTALGRDPSGDPELEETPERVVEAFEKDFLAGYVVDVSALLSSAMYPVGSEQEGATVIVRDISVATMCPHHLLPALGTASIAYKPGSHVLGIGTLARLVDALARRLTLQETISNEVVRALCNHAGARGAACRLELWHTCLAARGARQPQARVVTIATQGDMLADARDAIAGAEHWP